VSYKGKAFHGVDNCGSEERKELPLDYDREIEAGSNFNLLVISTAGDVTISPIFRRARLHQDAPQVCRCHRSDGRPDLDSLLQDNARY